MIFRVFDIETVPDESVWTPPPPKWEVSPRVGNEGRRLFLPEDVALDRVEPFPPPHACRVVAISYVDVAMDPGKATRYSFGGMRSECRWSLSGDPSVEKRLLRSFVESTAELSASGGLCFVTWNGRGFDLPVINLRCLMHGIPSKWYYEDRDVRYRYSTEGHLDLMDFLGDYGAARNMKLGDVARLVGLPGKTGEVTGGAVHAAYLDTLSRSRDADFCDRTMGDVGDYCLRDSLQTALVFLRTRYHLGKVDLAGFRLCADTFAQDPGVLAAVDVDWDAYRVRDGGVSP